MDRRRMDIKVTIGHHVCLIYLGIFLRVTRVHDYREHRLRHRQMADICRRKILQHRRLRQSPIFLRARHAPHLLLSRLLRSWHSLFTYCRMVTFPHPAIQCQGWNHQLFRSLHHQFRPTADQCLFGMRYRSGHEVEMVGQFLWAEQYSS